MLRRGLLLDRDGVINVDKEYVGKREQFEFIPGILPFLRAVQDFGFRIAILTNQSGVARGYYTVKDYEQLTEWMLEEFAKQTIVIDLTLACFEHKEGSVAEFGRESFWRKPNPGMVLEAAQRLRLDLPHSAFLGDNLRDMQAAQVGGVGKRLLLSQNLPPETPSGVMLVKNFDAALKNLAPL